MIALIFAACLSTECVTVTMVFPEATVLQCEYNAEFFISEWQADNPGFEIVAHQCRAFDGKEVAA